MEVKISQQGMVYLAVCSLALLLFILLGLVPSGRHLASLNEKIAETKARIEEQKQLQLIYITVKQMSQRQGTSPLPFPAMNTLPRTRIEQLPNMIGELARKANVEVVSVVPAVSSLADNSQVLSIDALMRGDFFSFRKFLSGLGGISSLKHVEEVQIQQSSNGMELKVKFSVACS